MKEKSYHSVTEKKILKILVRRDKLSKNKVLSLAKMSRKRCADSLDSLVKDKFLNLQNERYAITELGIAYLSDLSKRDKQDRQMRGQISGRGGVPR